MKRIQAVISGRRTRMSSAFLAGMVFAMMVAAVPAARAQGFSDDFNRPLLGSLLSAFASAK